MSMLEKESKGLWGGSEQRDTSVIWSLFKGCRLSMRQTLLCVQLHLYFLWTFSFFFGTKLKRHTPPGWCNRDALSNATHVFMNSIYERFCTCGVGLLTFREWRECCVGTLCSRTQVFKSCIYDSAKGWGFTESPCFFQHLHFNRNVS